MSVKRYLWIGQQAADPQGTLVSFADYQGAAQAAVEMAKIVLSPMQCMPTWELRQRAKAILEQYGGKS